MTCTDIILYQENGYGKICIIEVPPKIWRPKVESRYRMPEYATDINEGAWDFSNYGKTVFKPKLDWQDTQRDDLINFQDSHQDELEADLRMGTGVDKETKEEIVNIIKSIGTAFVKKEQKELSSDMNLVSIPVMPNQSVVANRRMGHMKQK